MAEAFKRITMAIKSDINEKNIEILKNKNQKLETELLTLRTYAVFNLVIWEMNLMIYRFTAKFSKDVSSTKNENENL